MNALPNREDFTAALNTNFEARADAEKVFEMTLIEVKNVISNKIQECFSLLFRTTAGDAPLFQQSFRLRHEQLGEMELFLVPIKKNENGLFYEAVFNKLLV